MSRLRVGLLSNPTAAHGAAQRTGRQVAHLLQLAGLSVVDISGPSAHVARARALEIRDSLTALIVVGGDGTVALGAEIVAGTPVRLGIVPAGSGNDFSRVLDLPRDAPQEAVRTILHALSRPALAIDAIELTSADPSALPHRSIVMGNVSLGFDAVVNARANAARGGGRHRYTLATLRELPAFRPLPYWMSIDDGERIELDATFVTVCNSGFFGGGMHLVPSARVDDGLLDVVTLRDVGRTTLMRFLPRVFRGTHTTVPGFDITPARTITVGLRDDRSLRTYADGEARALLPITARVLPGAVRILADPPADKEDAPGRTA